MLSALALTKGQSITWTAPENLSDSLRLEKKPLLVFIHTKWCKYCQIQENSTFKNPEVIQVLNRDFYCLRLNAEDTADIPFLGRVYKFQTAKGHHKLAELLGMQNNELIFPTTVIIQENLQTIHRLQGLQKSEQLIAAMRLAIKP